jgi:CheY-like chemotaxis protein/curved DNA-binding protein CbpA
LAATILCADDDRHYCQILSRAFEQEGYAVETAFDGEEALEKIRTLRPQLVTLDVMLPRRDGFQVLESLRGSDDGTNDIPVLLVSGCSITADYQARANGLAASAVFQKPVPLNTLLGAVADHVNQGATASRVEAAEGGEALSGTLDDLPTAPLLHQLHGLRATGVLQVQHGKKRKQVQLRDGTPIAVRSNLVQETLGHLLLASGKITEDVLHASLTRVKRGEGLHGQILKAMHMLDEADLAAALRLQADEKLLDMFGWSKGRYRFHRGARLKSANALTVKRSAASLVWQGTQERVPIAIVDRFLEVNAQRAPVQGESAFYNYQDVELGDEVTGFIAQVDGSVQLQDYASQAEAARRSLYGLIVLGMLELREFTRTRPPRPARTARRTLREVNRNVQSAEDRALAGDREEEDDKRVELTQMAERMSTQDHFEILGVSRGATDEEIRGAYALLAKQTHPDRFVDASDVLVRVAEEVFGMISSAYDEIGEREKRNVYLRKQQGRDADQRELEIGQRAVQAELSFQKGEVALKAGQVSIALPLFEKAAETYPEEGEYVAYWGWTWYLADPDEPKRLERAITIVQRGRKLAPDREKPYLFLGRLCKASGRMDAAEKMFMRAVQLDPDSVEALRELRLIDMRREKSKSFVNKILRR